MHIQTIGLSVIRRNNLPILKFSPNFNTFFLYGSEMLGLNRESRGMRLRNEGNFECVLYVNCASAFYICFHFTL